MNHERKQFVIYHNTFLKININVPLKKVYKVRFSITRTAYVSKIEKTQNRCIRDAFKKLFATHFRRTTKGLCHLKR